MRDIIIELQKVSEQMDLLIYEKVLKGRGDLEVTRLKKARITLQEIITDLM